jgi:hypothetical protein
MRSGSSEAQIALVLRQVEEAARRSRRGLPQGRNQLGDVTELLLAIRNASEPANCGST